MWQFISVVVALGIYTKEGETRKSFFRENGRHSLKWCFQGLGPGGEVTVADNVVMMTMIRPVPTVMDR